MQELDHNESSDMQEIKNEEIVIKETLMWIDSSTKLENIITVISFVAIIILTICTGVIGTPSINSQKSIRNFKDTNMQRLSFDAAPISSYNRFISFDVFFIKKDPSKAVTAPVSFQYFVECSSKDKSFNKTVHTYTGNAIGDAGNNLTHPFYLYNDRLIDYQSVEIVVVMDKTTMPDFTGIVIYTKLGTHDQTTFQCYFRLVYSLFELYSMFTLFTKMRKDSHLFLHLEQKLMIPLIICAILSNNPFYIFHAYNPGHLYYFIYALSSALFEGCLCLGILIVFEYIRQKNVKFDLEFLFSKLVYCGIIAIAHFLHELHYAIGTYSDPPINGSSSTEFVLRMLEVALLCGFVFWAFSLFSKCLSSIDITERSKFIMYSYANIVTLIGIILFNIIATTFGLFKDTPTIEVSKFVFANVYVLMMIYFHWPYSILYEQDYVEEGSGQENHAPIADIADPMPDDNQNFSDDEEDIDDDEEEEEEEE